MKGTVYCVNIYLASLVKKVGSRGGGVGGGGGGAGGDDIVQK